LKIDEDTFEEPEVDDLPAELGDIQSFIPESDQDEDQDDIDDSEELDRRKTAYSELKKVDKIFNNSYIMGLPNGEDQEDPKPRGDIRLDVSSPDYHLYDRDQHSDHVDNSIIQVDIHNFVSTSTAVQLILGDDDKKKFTKDEVNTLFELIRNGVSHGEKASAFVSAIHVLDSISSLTRLEYKKLFDMCKYENKEILLLELDTKYHFLDKASGKPSKTLKNDQLYE
jgi:hypothetical protein